jgi:hypothetical protein
MASVLTLVAPALAAVLAVGTGACTVEEGRPPLARIELVPEAIPENDGFQTPVVLDGTASADPIDDPDGSARLDYAWAIDGDEYRFDAGDAGSDMPTLSFRGDRPATIVLTVTDADGLDASATVNLQLSVR